MKNFFTIGAFVICACILLSCTKEHDIEIDITGENQEETITRSVTVSQDTKSTIDGEGNISWESGDCIYYYDYYEDGTASGKKSVTFEESGQCVSIDLNIRKAGRSLALIMPGKDGRDGNNHNKSSVPTAFAWDGINPDQDGSFAYANISSAYSDDAQNVTSLTFKNIASILKFNVPSALGITKVTLEPNSKTTGNEIAGRISVDLTAANPIATFHSGYPNKLDRPYEVVIDKGEEVMNGTYYMAVMPATLSSGFTLTFNDGTAQTIAGKTYTKQKYVAGTSSSVTFEANHIKNVGNPIENKRITSFTIDQIATDKGWEDNTRQDSFSVDDFITFTGSDGGKGNGWHNIPTGTTTHEWRCYQARNNGIFTVSCPEGRKIASVTFVFTLLSGGAIQYNGNTYASTEKITAASATNSMEFSVVSTTDKTDAQVKIREVTVETK